MRILRIVCAALMISIIQIPRVYGEWLTFVGGPVVSVGTWPAGGVLTGAAVATASNFVNGNPNTPFIGLTPINVPNLSPDYFATTLTPNPGPSVASIGTPYNDSGDTYHVEIDFTATTSPSGVGVLPAGSIFAILDLDINENYRNVTAFNAANVQIATPWISGPNGYFDMTNPMIPQGSLVPNPTLTGPVGGVYQMFGVSYNFDVGMWLFQTTQNVRRIAFDMERAVPGNVIGGGGATWAFYTPRIPEPSSIVLVCCSLAAGGCLIRRRRRH